VPFRPNYRKLGLFAALILVILFRNMLVAALLPFVLAFILAAMIDPIIETLQQRLRLPRGVAVLFTLAALIAVSGYVASLVLAKVAAELVDLASGLPAYQRELSALTSTLIARFNELYENLPAQVTIYLQSTINDVSRNVIGFLADTIDRTLRAITALPSLVVVIVVTVLATYFLSRDREQLSDAFFRFLPERWQKPMRDAQDKIVVDLIGFLKAQLFIFLLTTGVASLGLYLIGTRFWMILGITLGVLDIIPIVGPGLILFPWAGVSILMDEFQRALFLCLIFLAILVIRQTAQATVLGESIGVHPLAMLVAVYGGIVAFGVKGMFIGPLLVIVGKALWGSGLLAHLRPDAQKEKKDRPPATGPSPADESSGSQGNPS